MNLSLTQSSRKKILAAIAILSMLCFLTGCNNNQYTGSNKVTFEGTDYIYLEYPTDVFYYDYHGTLPSDMEEVDAICPIQSPQWNCIWNGGDLYVAEEDFDDAQQYVLSEDNYDWFVLLDSENQQDLRSIELTDDEREAVYAVDSQPRETAVYFDDFQALGSMYKISKDGMVRGTLSLAKYNGMWHWKSEIIDDSQTKDDTWPEYIQPLPESLNEKLLRTES